MTRRIDLSHLVRLCNTKCGVSMLSHECMAIPQYNRDLCPRPITRSQKAGDRIDSKRCERCHDEVGRRYGMMELRVVTDSSVIMHYLSNWRTVIHSACQNRDARTECHVSSTANGAWCTP